MNAGESIFLKEGTKRANNLISQGKSREEINFGELEDEVLRSPNIVPGTLREEIAGQSKKIRNSRLRTAGRVRREVAEKWKPALSCLDDCLALADLVGSRLVEAVFSNGNILRAKNPRPMPDRVTGAYLKCLHLVSLYGKSCQIGTEIAYLLKEGFPDAATSRFRTLHEHLVVGIVLLNDRTYEISEAYQDSAVFDSLKQLRADMIALSDPLPYWDSSATEIDGVRGEIVESEAVAAEVIARRGQKFKEQYEWARIALPEPKKSNLNYRITFADLEQSAGMGFLRRNYLLGNERIHAGAYSVINHLNFEDSMLSSARPQRNDGIIYSIGWGVSEILGWATRFACKGVASETEDWDMMLYVCEMMQRIDASMKSFSEAHKELKDQCDLSPPTRSAGA